MKPLMTFRFDFPTTFRMSFPATTVLAGLAALFAALTVAGSASAVPIFLGIEAASSSITPAGGPSTSISGYLRVDVGSLPPNTETVTFDLLNVVAESGGLDIRLDPAFASPGLGVLNTSGDFLIPNLQLEIDSGSGPAPIALANVLGTFDPGNSCGSTFCLDVQFAIQTGPTAEDQTLVVLHAVPEPTTLGMMIPALGLVLAAGRRRPARARALADMKSRKASLRGQLRAPLSLAFVALLCTGAAGSCGTGTPEVTQEVVHIQGYIEPHTPGSGAPEEVLLAADHPVVKLLGPNPDLNKVSYIRTSLEKLDGTTPDTILILIPGFLGGGTTFDPLARQLVEASAGNIEVWAVDRRPNQLEDRLGATHAVNGALSAACQQSPPASDCEIYEGAQFYFPDQNVDPPEDFPGGGDLDVNLNGVFDDQLALVDDLGVSRTAINLVQEDVQEFFAYWGIDTYVRDWKILTDAARIRVNEGGKHGVVLMGGHSQGTSWSTVFAAYDLDPDPGVVDAGYTHIDGLVLLEGGGLREGELSPLQIYGYEWVVGQIVQGQFNAFLEDFNGIPLVALGNSGEVAAIAGHFQPSEASLIQRTPTFGAGLVAILLGAASTNKAVAGFFLDDDFSPITSFRASIGFSDNGPNTYTILPGFAPFYLAGDADDGSGLRSWIDVQDIDPTCVDPLVHPGCAIVDNGPPSDPDDPNAAPVANGVEREVSDIDTFLRTQFGKANGFEWYFVDERVGLDFDYGRDSSAMVQQFVDRDGNEGPLVITQNANVDIPVLGLGGSNGLAPEAKSFDSYFESIATPEADKRVVILEGYAHVDPTIADDNDAVPAIIDFASEQLQKKLLENF